MTRLKNYYVVLGVPTDADLDRIRSAYREVAKRLHPDHVGPPGAGRFREASEAYEVLSDPRQRARYDAELGKQLRPTRPSQTRPPARSGAAEPLISERIPITGNAELVRPSLESLLDRIGQNFTAPDRPKAEHVEPLAFELLLTPDEAGRGIRIPFEVPVLRRCSICGGLGREAHMPCQECEGHGYQADASILHVDVPAGVPDGTVIDASLEHLGIDNLWLEVHVRVAPH